METVRDWKAVEASVMEAIHSVRYSLRSRQEWTCIVQQKMTRGAAEPMTIHNTKRRIEQWPVDCSFQALSLIDNLDLRAILQRTLAGDDDPVSSLQAVQNFNAVLTDVARLHHPADGHAVLDDEDG